MDTLIPVVVVLGSIGLGIASCFFGFRLLRLMFALWGFVAGGVLGIYLGQSGGQTTQIALMFILGFIGLFLANFIKLLGVFAIGFAFGAVVSFALLFTFGFSTDAVWVVFGGAIGGLIALFAQRPVLIVATAFSGAGLLVNVALEFLPADVSQSLTRFGQVGANAAQPDLWVAFIALGAWVIIGLVGMLYQFNRS
jgi:hypothetical protein